MAEEGFLEGAEGASIYHRNWVPEDYKASVLLVHGLGEHCGRYEHVAAWLNKHGYAVYALDHVGHGKSSGVRACIRRFSGFLVTLKLYFDLVFGDRTDKPVFLIGHSMGGLISAHFLLAYQDRFRGCVLSGPAIKSGVVLPWYQKLIVTILSWIAPRLGLMKLDATQVSRDPEVVETYLADPLVHSGNLPVRTITELFAAMDEIQQRAGEIRLPMLMLHGDKDGLAEADGSRFLNDAISSTDKKLVIYPGLYHEIFNEPEQNDVLEEVVTWMDARI